METPKLTWLVVGDEWHSRLWGRVFLMWLLLQADWLWWNVVIPFDDWRQVRAYRSALQKHRRIT